MLSPRCLYETELAIFDPESPETAVSTGYLTEPKYPRRDHSCREAPRRPFTSGALQAPMYRTS